MVAVRPLQESGTRWQVEVLGSCKSARESREGKVCWEKAEEGAWKRQAGGQAHTVKVQEQALFPGWSLHVCPMFNMTMVGVYGSREWKCMA